MLTPAVTFTAFAIAQAVGGGSQFQVTTAFSSLSLLAILTAPVAELVTSVSNLTSALSCIDRIQEFLEREPRTDYRGGGSGTSPRLEHRRSASSQADRQVALSAGPQYCSEDTVIRIKGGAFGYPNGEPIIRDINIDIKSSRLLIVVGPVGCGKSTFLRSLLGETHVFAGSVDCVSPKQIAYCDQNPWILGISIKENILGISEYNEEKYREVLNACQLTQDLQQLPKGDETLAGSKGVSLSGGQRSRLVSGHVTIYSQLSLLMNPKLGFGQSGL